MRPQDEILVTLPRQPPQGRRFLLRRLGDLPQTEDARQVHVTIRDLAKTPGADVAAILCEESIWAKRELERLRRSVGEESGQGGTWTSFLQPAAAAARPDDIQDAGIAAGQALEAILEPLARGAARGEDECRWVAQVLGRIKSHASIELLMNLATDHGAVAPSVVALSQLGGDLATEKALLLTKAVEGTSVYPQLLSVFSSLSNADSFRFLVEQARGGNPEVCAGVAIALEGFQQFDPLSVLEGLAQVPDPWVLINTVETLGRIGSPDYLKRIEVVFQQQAHPLIRIACLQAISGSHGAIPLNLAEMGLACDDPNVKAAAVEAMVTAGVPYDRYRDKVVGLLNSAHPKLSMNAALACVAVDPAAAFQRVATLLSSGQPGDLLQAVHCLAYVEAASSIEALSHVIARCPPGQMRLHAVRALGRLCGRTPDAVGPLVKVLELNEDPASQEAAVWFLSNAHPAGRVEAAKAITTLLRSSNQRPIGIICIEALGLLGPSGQLSVPDLHHALLVGPRQAHAAARALAVSFPRSKEAEDLRSNDSTLIQGYGGLIGWFENGAGLEMLFQALSQQNQFAFQVACGVSRLAAASGSWTAETRRLVGLAKSLGAANIDAAEAMGLGRLDQSLSLPRKKIGLGIVPKANPSTKGLAPQSLKVAAPVASPQAEREAADEEALLSHSYYETATQEAVVAARAGPPPAQVKSSSPAVQGQANLSTGTSGGLPSTLGTKLAEAARVIGLVVLCFLAVRLGQWLKTVL